MDASLNIGIAAFVVDEAGARSCELLSALRVRAASVAKPLLFWAAAAVEPFATDHAAWEALARPAVTVSDNQATAEMWSRVGGAGLLAALYDLSGIVWDTDSGGEHEALRLLVTAYEVATAYATFILDESDTARQLRSWMREVPEAQTFGVRQSAIATLGVPEDSVGVKCGWFGGDRAHAVVVADLDDAILGAVVTTSRPANAASREACELAAGNSTKLIAIHEAIAGTSIRLAVRQALEFATSL